MTIGHKSLLAVFGVIALALAWLLIPVDSSQSRDVLGGDPASKSGASAVEDSGELEPPILEAGGAREELAARGTGDAGEVSVEDSDGEVAHIVALVVSTAGKPVGGVPVVLQAAHPEDPALAVPVAEVVTDALTGLARIPVSPEIGAGLARPDRTRTTIAIDLPLAEFVEAELPLGLPVETIRLVLPEGAEAWLAPLLVRVVRPGGTPLGGIEVVFRAVNQGKRSERVKLGSGRTGAGDGIAAIPRTEQRELMKRAGWMGARFEFEVTLDAMLAEPPVTMVPPTPSAEPVLITMPPSATVVVALETSAGEPARGAATVAVWSRPRRLGDEGSFERVGEHIREFVDGRAIYENVGLDLDLRLSAGLSDSSVKGVSLETSGPTRADSEHIITLRLGPAVPVIVGRMVDEAAEPLAGIRLSLLYQLEQLPPENASAGRPYRNYSSLDCDADGRFRIPFHGAKAEPRGRFAELVEKGPRSGNAPGWVARFARVPLPAVMPDGGAVDVGDVVLSRMPVLVAGSVVDAGGRPVQGARLSIAYPFGAGRGMRWYNLNVPFVSTDESGAFAVHAINRVRELSLGASRGKANAAEVRVLPGTLDARLVLLEEDRAGPAGGRVFGSVVLDELVGHDLLRVALQFPSGGWRKEYFGPSGFVFRDVPAGDVAFEVRTHGTDWPVASVQGVEVRAGEDTRDPRLQALDLRAELRLMPLKLALEDGRPVVRKWVWVYEAGGRGGAIRTDEEGRLIVLTRVKASQFRLHLPGYGDALCDWAPNEQVLVFQAN